MSDLIDIVEVFETNQRIANILLRNGWKLLNTFTITTDSGIPNDLELRYSLGRPFDVDYSKHQAVEESKQKRA